MFGVLDDDSFQTGEELFIDLERIFFVFNDKLVKIIDHLILEHNGGKSKVVQIDGILGFNVQKFETKFPSFILSLKID